MFCFHLVEGYKVELDKVCNQITARTAPCESGKHEEQPTVRDRLWALLFISGTSTL